MILQHTRLIRRLCEQLDHLRLSKAKKTWAGHQRSDSGSSLHVASLVVVRLLLLAPGQPSVPD
jgi:hypothetical protein